MMARAQHLSAPAAAHKGFSLVEVLVALLVLSIGLLGLAALQTTSLQFNTGSYHRTQATYFVYDIIDRMRLNNAAAVSDGAYDVPTTDAAATMISNYTSCDTSACACDTSSCNATNLAIYDLGKWYQRVRTTLPGTTENTYLPTIDIDASKTATITMRWRERDLDKELKLVVQLWNT